MTEHHKVSIVIPNYNREDLIAETLDSIISQTYKNWECIIVDDGSTDRSVDVIQKYVKKDSRFILIERSADYLKGANSCRNIGLQKAVGDYIIFFDSDDLMMEHHVAAKLQFMLEGNLDYAVFKSKNYGQPDDVEEELDYSYYEKYDFTADNYLLNKLRFFTNDLIVKSELAKKCEFFFKYRADIENVLMTQLVLRSEKNGFKNENVTLKRYHEANLTQSIEADRKKFHRHIFYYYYNILGYIYNLKASSEATDHVLNQLLYHYRNTNFKLEVSFFEFLSQILKFKKPKIALGIVVHRLKKFKD